MTEEYKQRLLELTSAVDLKLKEWEPATDFGHDLKAQLYHFVGYIEALTTPQKDVK